MRWQQDATRVGGTPPWRRPGRLCFTKVGSVMKSTQRGLQITLGFFEAGLWTTFLPCLQKALWNLVGLVDSPWSNSFEAKAGWDSHHPWQDVEIPSANLRTPYMYDAAQERWAGELNVWQKEWKEISLRRPVGKTSTAPDFVDVDWIVEFQHSCVCVCVHHLLVIRDEVWLYQDEAKQ